MMSFDMATAALLASLLYIVMPTFTWFVLGESRNRAAALWCMGGIAIGIALFMISVHSGSSQAALVPSIANFLILFSTVIRVKSLRMELGRPYTNQATLLALLIGMLLFEVLHRVVGLYVPRALFFSFAAAFGMGLIALNALQIAREQQSKMAAWIALSYCAVAVAFLFRMVYLSQEDFSRVEGNVLTDGAASVTVAVVMLLSSVIGHFGYVGLFFERAQRQAALIAADQARAEVSQQLGAQIALLERRQSLGELAASISHELNQPLTAILTNAQLAKRGLKTGRLATDMARQLMDKIEYNTQRASGILERVHNFMRAGSVQCGLVDLKEVAHSVLQLMGSIFETDGVRVEVETAQGPLLVQGDALELSQVLLNLIKNAVDSMAAVKDRRIKLRLDLVDGKVCVYVRDSGPGLNEEQNAKAGTPFFTTKQQGLGMGLAVSRSIMRRHGGSLSVVNADDGAGIGALALMELPLAQEKAA